MRRKLWTGFLVLAGVVCAQHRVDPRNTYNRIICVVPLTGSGTPADPRRPKYTPWPPFGQVRDGDAMRRARLAAVCLSAAPVWASYSYYLSDTLSTVDP